MAIKNRTDLKSFFVKNAIPTEGNFADLIDSQLNQAQDGVFKPEGEPLSVVAAPGDQKRVLRLYANHPQANPDWMISLNPAQDPATAGTSRAGLGVTDGAGNTRLFVEAGTGRIGIGTNLPQFPLDVAGQVRVNGVRGRNDLVLDSYQTANPASNVYLHSPAGDRDAWIYRDAGDSTSNWGIYHRQIDSPVAGLPGNSIGFVGGGTSKLQAYVNLSDGSASFAGSVRAAGGVIAEGELVSKGFLHATGNACVANMVGEDHAYIQWFPMKMAAGRKGWIGYGGPNTTTLTISNEANGELRLESQTVNVPKGILRIGDWTLVSEGTSLAIKQGANIVARFSVGFDRFLVYEQLNGSQPYFYFNQNGAFARHPPRS